MATTLAPSINFTNVSKGLNSLNTGVGNLRKSSDSVKTVSLNRTKIKRESFARDKVLTSMREEAVRRKDQESIIEASGIGGAMRRSASVIADSTKGFLGRILDFASSLLIGWLLFNLPTIMTAIEDMIVRITSLTQLLQDFISNITNTFTNFGNLLSGVYQNVTQFDFTDESKRVQNAMDDLNINLETMRDQFMQGFDMLSKPLGEGPGEEPVPELNTDYTQDGPTTGGGEGGGIERISKTIAKAETGGRYTAYAGDGGKGNQEITKMTLTQLRQKYGDYNTAVGAYQFMPGTAIGLAKQLKLDPNKTVFTPEVQDRLNQYHLKTMGYEQFKSGKLSQAEFGTRIAQQYRALPDPRTGRTYADQYAKDNAAQIPLSEFNTALKESKEQKSTSPKPQSGKGGKVVEYITGDRTHKRYAADHGGRNYHDHVAFDSQATRDSAMKWLRSRGWTIGSINTGRHANGSFHYSNQAFDIPFYSGNNTKKGVTDDVKGETKLSSMLRADLIAGGFGGPQLGGSSISPAASAQVSSTTQPGQNVPSVAQNKRGQQIIIADNPQQPQPQQASAGGGGSQPQMIPTESSLNSLIKNQILLELAYT
jgi:hypothetical protein